MKTARVTAMLTGAMLALALAPAWALAEPAAVDVGPDADPFLEHVDRVEVGATETVIVLEVQGREHEVTVDYEDAFAEIGERLTDDEADVVDLAAIPVFGGVLLKAAGLLLRLGRS